ncbi:phage head-binding domain-containing protein [Escherichia coli]|nr:phage head-binding domain-containing protein [Escherichia coli]EHK0353464.1 phage head-binding domain-containing protein [Escherichia coli]EHL4961425.1 phage head-binding domain-containing protein [Escherichia coli]
MTDITANVVVSMPSQLFTMARSFKAVANGKIYIGKIDTDPVNPENQIQVYVENEDGSHVPVSQPIIINAAGYPVYNGQIAKFVTVQGHSMAVYDAYGAQQFYFPNVLKYDPDQLSIKLSSNIGYKYIGMVESANSLKDIQGMSISDKLYLKSYVSGLELGGGFVVAVDKSIAVDNVMVLEGNGVNWKRINPSLEFSVYDAGYSGAGDIALFINKINSLGYDCVVPCSGEFSSLIDIDFAKGGLRGSNKCVLTEINGISGDYAIRLSNSNISYDNRDEINATSILDGISFKMLGSKKILLGGIDSGELSELRISNSSFISSAGIEFLDNSYRILFDKVTISKCLNNTIIFNSPSNSGEVMTFNNCWVVDNGGPLTIRNGQFIFNCCSMPAGKKEGYFDSTVFIEDNATVVYSSGNIEFQPGQSFVAFVVGGSSRLSIKDSTLLTTSGYSAIPIVANDDAVVSLTNCSLPLYEQTEIAAGAAARQIIGGNSKKVMSYGCYPRAGFITANWDKGNIVSAYINSLSNGSGQFLNYSNWSLQQTGSGVVTAGTDSDVPNDIMFSRSLYVAIPSIGASAKFYQECSDCSPGRYFQLGFWAKNQVTTIAGIEFFDKEGNSVQGKATFTIPPGSTWNFYALIDIVPPGASKVRIDFDVSGEAGSLHLHNVIYGLI